MVCIHRAEPNYADAFAQNSGMLAACAPRSLGLSKSDAGSRRPAEGQSCLQVRRATCPVPAEIFQFSETELQLV